MKYIFHFYSGTVVFQRQDLISVKGTTGYRYTDLNRFYYWTQNKTIILLKTALNNNKNLYHENVSIVQKSIISLMKAKASAAYYTLSLALRECTLH